LLGFGEVLLLLDAILFLSALSVADVEGELGFGVI